MDKIKHKMFDFDKLRLSKDFPGGCTVTGRIYYRGKCNLEDIPRLSTMPKGRGKENNYE